MARHRWDEGFAGPVVEVRAVAPEDAVLLHECEDGHSWQEKPNGTVSPSYGLGATEYSWPDYNPRTCPEPEQMIDEGWAPRIKCPGCGKIAAPHDLLAGLSSSPWDLSQEAERTGHTHTAPSPACRKPSVSTMRWMEIKTTIHKEVKGGFKKVVGWTAGWVPVEEAAALEAGAEPPPDLFDEKTRARAREIAAGWDG